MAREVSVRLSADISAYLTAMGQAEQATSRVADAADRLGDISISADSSVAADLDTAASSADNAASSMEGAAGSAESMSGGMDSAGASAQTAAGGLQEAGAAGENAAASVGQVSAASLDTTAAMLAVSGAAHDASGGMQTAGAAADDVAASVGNISASSLDTAAAMSTVSAAAQDSAAGLQAAGAAGQDAGAGIDSVSGAAQSASAALESASGSAQSAAGGLESAGASAQGVGAGLESAGASAQQAGAGLESAGASALVFSSNLDGSGGSAQTFASSLSTVGAQSQSIAADLQAAGASAQVMSSNLDGSGASAQSFAASLSTVGAQSQDAAGAMQSLSGAAQDSAGGLDTAAGAAGTAGGAFGTLISDASGMQSEFRALGGAMAVVGGGMTAMAGYVLNVGIQYNNLQQVAGQALSTMTDSAADAADQMDRLNEFASTSPFFRDTWLTAQQQLMAFGMEAERVVPTLEGIEEAVAAIGGGDQEIRQLVDILGQVQGQGRITGRELQRMGQMGIDAASIIGEQMGYTGDQIREQITAGALDAETAIDALATGMSTRFEGSADAVRNTFQGALNDVIAFTRDIGSIIATPLVNPEGGGFLVDIMNMAGNALLALRDLPAPLIQIAGLGTLAAGGFIAISGAIGLALPQLTAFWGGVTSAWNVTRDFTGSLVNAAGGWRRFAAGAGLAVAAMAGLAVLRHISEDAEDVATSVRGMSAELVRAAEGGDAFTNVDWTRTDEGRNSINSLSEAFERVNRDGFGGWQDGVNRFLESATGVDGAISDLDQNFQNIDESMAQAFQEGRMDEFAAGFQVLKDEADAAGWSIEDFTDTFPQLTEEIESAARAAGATASTQDILAIATNAAALEALQAGESWEVVQGILDGTARSMENASGVAQSSASGLSDYASIMAEIAEVSSEAASALDSVVDSYRALGIIQLDAVEAAGALEATFRDLNDSIEENGASLDVSTEGGYANFQAFRQASEGAWDLAEAQLAAGDSSSSVADGLMDQYNRLVEVAQGMDTGSLSAEEYAAQMMGIPESRTTDVEAYFEDFATDGVEALNVQLEGIPDLKEVRIQVDDDGSIRYVELLDHQIRSIEDQTVSVITTDDGTILEVQGAIEGVTDGDALIHVDDDGTITEVQGEITGMQNGDATIEVDDDGTISIVQGEIQSMDDGSALVDVSGDTTPAQEAITALEAGDYSTVTRIIGEDEEARATITQLVNENPETWMHIFGEDEPARQTLDAISNDVWTAPVIGEARTERAVAQLDDVARHRIAEIMAAPDAMNAEGELNQTARDRISQVLAASDTSLAEGDLTNTARNRISNILADPSTYNAEGQLTQTARQRIANILADPSTWNAESALTNTARGRTSSIVGSASTWAAEAAINRTARNRTATITINAVAGRSARSVVGSMTRGLAAGGRAGGLGAPLPAYSTGGRLQNTGLGTDSILGISRSGTPTAWVDDREWIINQGMSDKYDRALAAINADHPSIRHLAGYADGGRARSFAAPQHQAYSADQLSEAIRSGVGGMAGVSIGEITAVGGDTDQVVNRVGDEIFRRLRQEGVPVGSF